VITGDITQIDLPTGRRSGLLEAIDVLSAVEGISFIHFDERDVVRHDLVQRIVRAYDEYSKGNLAPQGTRPAVSKNNAALDENAISSAAD
jgi:phosphate starvation-inducible protein PhoH